MIGFRWFLWPVRALLGRCRGCGVRLHVAYVKEPIVRITDEVGWVWCVDCAVEFKRPMPREVPISERLLRATTKQLCEALKGRGDGMFVVLVGEASAVASGGDTRILIDFRCDRRRMQHAIQEGLSEFQRRFPR